MFESAGLPFKCLVLIYVTDTNNSDDLELQVKLVVLCFQISSHRKKSVFSIPVLISLLNKNQTPH